MRLFIVVTSILFVHVAVQAGDPPAKLSLPPDLVAPKTAASAAAVVAFLEGPAADKDGNGRLTALELFNYLNTKLDEAQHDIEAAAAQLELVVRRPVNNGLPSLANGNHPHQRPHQLPQQLVEQE